MIEIVYLVLSLGVRDSAVVIPEKDMAHCIEVRDAVKEAGQVSAICVPGVRP